MTPTLKVAYFLSRFPRLTETFIYREISMLKEIGVEIEVFSLLSPFKETVIHPQAQALVPGAHYSPYFFSVQLLLANLYFLTRFPGRYFRALYRAVWQTLPEPSTLIKILSLFPKSVYFARLVQQQQVVHIHAHFVWISGLSAQIASDLTGVPYSLHAHAWDVFMRKPKAVGRQIELANKIVTISTYHRQYLESLSSHPITDKIRIVHCGVDPTEFLPGTSCRKKNPIQILSIGRMVEKKGFEYLLDACARLIERGHTFQCSIVGDGPLQARLQARIDSYGMGSRVKLLGSKSIAEIQGLLDQSDLFVLPCVVTESGDRDGIPVVLMEAMSMEVPVVTTSVSGNRELVSDGITGLLVPERDAETLATAIEQLITNSSLRCQMGKRGRQKILSDFNIYQTAEQMRLIFQETLQK